MGGLTETGQVYTLVRPKSLTGEETVEFLEHLGRQIKGPALVMWDGSPIHRRALVNEFVAAVGAENLQLERLPADAAGSQPDRMAVASPQGSGDGQPDLPGPRRVA